MPMVTFCIFALLMTHIYAALSLVLGEIYQKNVKRAKIGIKLSYLLKIV